MGNFHSNFRASVFVILLLVNAFVTAGSGQKITNPNKGKPNTAEARFESINLLNNMFDVLQDKYYDPKFGGIDLKAKWTAAKARINTLTYDWEMQRVLVQFLMDLDDSHTYLDLPPRSDHFSYGFSMQIIGRDCMVVSVRKGTDADAKGISAGDRIVQIGKFPPTRDNLWKIIYLLYRLDPQDTVDLIIEKPDGSRQSMTVKATTMSDLEWAGYAKSNRLEDDDEPFKCKTINSEVIACRLASFITEKSKIDAMMRQVASYPKMILDLRSNSGGYVEIEEYLTGYFFNNEVKIADFITRKRVEVRKSKPRKEGAFKGELAVLLDSRSASASEVFARVVQIEKRGKVFGDVSSGAVMTSTDEPLSIHGFDGFSTRPRSNFIMSFTIGELKMSDGGRLEKVGVIPDYPVIPTAAAVAKQSDPVLAYAATLFGAQLDPATAGSYFLFMERSN